MWSRCIVMTALFCFGCGGPPPTPPSAPEPTDMEEPGMGEPGPVDEPEPTDVEPTSEPAPEPTAETPKPAPTKPKPRPEPTCAELDKGRCEVTEGCEWHSVKKCLEQEKPKTLDD